MVASEHKTSVFATKEDIGNLRAEIKETKADLIKWMFAFWIGSVGVISGITIAILNAYLRH